MEISTHTCRSLFHILAKPIYVFIWTQDQFFYPAWQKSHPCLLSQFLQLLAHHCLKRTLFQISVRSVLIKKSHWVPNLDCFEVVEGFPLERLQQFLSLASSMAHNNVIQEGCCLFIAFSLQFFKIWL